MSRMRTEVSKSNQFYISKHRYYELKHFCLQYREWAEMYVMALNRVRVQNDDPTGTYATIMADCKHCMDLVRNTADNTDSVLGSYIFDHVTKGKTYERLRTYDGMPCGRDLFYAYIRKFFWLLSNKKGV